MELDNMKALWEQYDKNLQNNTITNERMMRSMLAERSASRLSRFVNMEYFSLSLMGILLAIFISLMRSVGSELQMVIPYIASLVIFALSIGWGIYKLRLLNATDFHAGSIIETRERVQKLRLIYAREKVWSIVLLPLIVCCIAPVLHHWIWGGYILDRLREYLPKTIALCVLGMVLTYWMYKVMYAKSIKAILHNLEEIGYLKRETN